MHLSLQDYNAFLKKLKKDCYHHRWYYIGHVHPHWSGESSQWEEGHEEEDGWGRGPGWIDHSLIIQIFSTNN